MPEETLKWRTDRKDLVERVRTMSVADTKELLRDHATRPELRRMSHEEAANRLMILLLSGEISEEQLPK